MRWQLALALLAACGPPPRPIDPRFAEIAEVNHAKCGTCHRRVEPGEKSREHLETALKPHRRRVQLTDAQWASMVDFLAADGQ